MNRDLGIYFGAVVLVSLGMYVHVVLFNLYLADLSFREDLMGRLEAARTLGTALGTLPAAALARRLGLRFAILTALCGLALSLALRAVAGGTALVAASLLTGFFLAGWFVTNAPAIAALSWNPPGVAAEGLGGPRTAAAFSYNTALGIGVGAAGGLLAGWLPGWLRSATPAAGKQSALLVAAALVSLGAVVVLRVRFREDPKPALRNPKYFLLRRSPARAFLLRFLLAVSLWYAFGAGFAPFFNVYLRNRLGAPVETVGGVFALAQVAQALAALLMAPLIFRLGLVRAVVLTQLLSAAALFALWPVGTLALAATLYVVYLSFQVMSEPGLQNLLMARVPPEERPAASAANLLLMFAMHTTVAAAAGALIAAQGYAALFAALGITGVAAAALFAALFSPAFLRESARLASNAGSSPARHE